MRRPHHIIEPLDGSRHPFDPDEDEIRQLCLVLQSGWGEIDRERRRNSARFLGNLPTPDELREIERDKLTPVIRTNEISWTV